MPIGLNLFTLPIGCQSLLGSSFCYVVTSLVETIEVSINDPYGSFQSQNNFWIRGLRTSTREKITTNLKNID